MLPLLAKEAAKLRKSGFAFKAALCLGGVLTTVVLWSGITKGGKVDNGSVIREGSGSETVPVAKASREDLAEDISLYGELRPYQEIMVHAKVSGYVQSIRVDIGDHVQAGESLAKLEIPELNDDRNRASAAILKSEEEVKRAEADYRDAHLAYQTPLGSSKVSPDHGGAAGTGRIEG